ncbi:cytochrome b/b6 domain-containing protein [Sandarakinorhabdus rubra]|uniref:cytochrome b/b6 domain-containing protein n=1 Tax=Sandarakinorhabdus rubra TaxID=2672568 RepID=UPI0013DC9508|nr:cytochrome b/b6 domain-containing protein [Sandarakinorhabdus rubra]
MATAAPPVPADQPAPPPAPASRRVLRHSLLVRLTHWTNALAIFFLLMTGLNIFGAHPRLYWGHAGSVDQVERQWLQMGASGSAARLRGWVDVGDRRFDTTGLLGASESPKGAPSIVAFPHWATLPAMRDLATARTWHFFFAWVLILNGLMWLGYGLVSGRIGREILPSLAQLRPAHLWHDIVEHAKLNFPKGEAALSYEVLQRLAYAGVALVLIPVVILTGMAMSPGLNAAFPFLDALWGGRQSARSVHFIAMAAIAGFMALHLALVLLSGPVRQIGAMITGRMTIGGGK